MTDAAFAEPRRRGRPPRMRIEDGVLIEDEAPIDPAFRAADDLDPPEVSVPVDERPIPDGWFDMKDAPDDGKAIWVQSPEGMVVEAIWRHTRFYDRYNGGKWREIGYWALRNAGGMGLPFIPFCWRAV
jgi:hypothetical protein